MDGHDTHQVGFTALSGHDDDRGEPVTRHQGLLHRFEFGAFLTVAGANHFDFGMRNHNELRQVDGIGPFTQNAALRTALSTVLKEATHILEVIGFGHHFTQGLRRNQRLTITRKHVRDLSLRNGNERITMNLIHQDGLEMNPPTQQIRRVTGLAFKGDDVVFQGTFQAPPLFNHGHFTGGNNA